MSKTKKITVIVIIAIIIVALLSVGGVFAYNYINDLKNGSSASPLKVDSNVYLDDESAEKAADEKVSSINVNMRKKLKMYPSSDGKMTLELGLNNNNEHQYIVSISVEDKTIYTSDLIPAGASLAQVDIDDLGLDSGTYEAVAIFTVINEKDNQSVMGATGMSLPMEVTR